jgi:TonB family protein
MKFLLLLLSCCLGLAASAQVPAEYAHFRQGIDSEEAYIRNHLIYPEDAWRNGIQGQVKCKYIVTKEGHVTDVRVIKGINSEIDSEAVRVISSLPDFVPTMFRGAPQRTTSIIYVNFAKPMIYASVDQQPEFPGGQEALLSYVKNNIPYPESTGALMGKVTFELVVDADGRVIYASPDKTFGVKYQKQIRQFFRAFPKFKPAVAGGEKVCTRVSVMVDISKRVR